MHFKQITGTPLARHGTVSPLLPQLSPVLVRPVSRPSNTEIHEIKNRYTE